MVEKNNYLTVSDLNMIYKELAKPMPEESVQFANTKSFKGYDSLGISYQYCVNRFNEVVGPAHWNVKHDIIEQKDAGKLIEVTIHLVIQLGNWKTREVKDRDGNITIENYFEVLAERDCYGGHSSKFLFDALKGAYTNAFKKTAALFGVGRQAYEGSLDDDFINPDGSAEGTVGAIPRNNNENKSKGKGKTKEETKDGKMKPGQERTIKMMIDRAERRKSDDKDFEFNLDNMLSSYEVKSWEELNEGQADQFIKELTKVIRGR